MIERAFPFLVAAIGCVLACGTCEAREVATSKYTSTAREKSVRFEQDSDDPTGFRARLRGFGPYDLEHVGGDERSWMNVLQRG
ncbi:MAG: hypothetical protein ACO1QR_00350, partial [Chthoniobacteraceae bacterium]